MAQKFDITTKVQNSGKGFVGLEVLETAPTAMYRNTYVLNQEEAQLLLEQLTEYVI